MFFLIKIFVLQNTMLFKSLLSVYIHIFFIENHAEIRNFKRKCVKGCFQLIKQVTVKTYIVTKKLIIYQHIIMISEGHMSYGHTEDWRNNAENSAAQSQKKYSLKRIKIGNKY